jgi:hypothetical protein
MSMKTAKHPEFWLLASVVALMPLAVQTGTRAGEPLRSAIPPPGHKPWEPGAAPHLLVLPWLVIDRNTNTDCAKLAPSQSSISEEAQRLAISGQAAMDNMVHIHGSLKMIPRKEWEPHWKELAPGQLERQGSGCAVCTPVGQLIRLDRTALVQFAQGLQADYVLLGVTVVPLTPERSDARPDDCCRAAPAQERQAVLARSSALLVRVRDGEVTWARDSRRLERDVPRVAFRAKGSRVAYTREKRVDFAVRDTAHDLGKAFRRDCQEALR